MHNPTRFELQTNLSARAKLIKETPLFVGLAEKGLTPAKQQIFLALVGLKPVSEATSGHAVETATGRRAVPDNPATVGDFLDSLGLAHRLQVSGSGTDAVVSLRFELVTAYGNAEDETTVGHLLGYPETAVRAFQSGELLSMEVQEQLEHEAGIADVPSFRFSRSDWRSEVEVVKTWQMALSQYGLLSLADSADRLT